MGPSVICCMLNFSNVQSFQTDFFFSKEIYKDRKKFSEQVFKVASSDLVNMGISVVSYTLKDVHDDQVIQFPLLKARPVIFKMFGLCDILCHTCLKCIFLLVF